MTSLADASLSRAAAHPQDNHLRPASDEGAWVVFSDDWGRHPSSCQHLVSRVLGDRPVVWVNTIGMRPPRLNWATLSRGMEKLRQWFTSPTVSVGEGHAENLQVLNPRMWPWMRTRWDRALNRRLLKRQLQRILATLPRPITVITTIPVVADLVSELPVDRWVYYCVDDFSVWPGLDQQAMARLERDLVQEVSLIIAASQVLATRLKGLHSHVELLTHGVDLKHWGIDQHRADGQKAVQRVAFWGLIDDRLDIEFLRALDAKFPEGEIWLIGPREPQVDLSSCRTIRWLGPHGYSELPKLAAEIDVLVMPYRRLPVTEAMQPLKLLEYLATGKPVVVRDLPAVMAWRDCLDVVTSAEDFAAGVAERFQTGLPDQQKQARQRLMAEDWQFKASQFEQFISAVPINSQGTVQ